MEIDHNSQPRRDLRAARAKLAAAARWGDDEAQAQARRNIARARARLAFDQILNDHDLELVDVVALSGEFQHRAWNATQMNTA